MKERESYNFERKFILGLVQDLKSYGVLDGSLKDYFQDMSCEDLSMMSSLKSKLIFSSEFEEEFREFERKLVNEDHEAKRLSTHVNTRIACANPVGAERFRKMLLEKHREIRHEVRRLHDLTRSLKSSSDEKDDIDYEITNGLNIPLHLKDCFSMAYSLTSAHPVTLLTASHDVARLYAEMHRTEVFPKNGRKRFELALVYPQEGSFSYLYPELVKSQNFADLFEAA